MEVTEEEAALIEAQEQARSENPAAATEAERQATENAAATEENKDAAEGEENKKEAIIILEDGKSFHGSAFGSKGETIGEVCFNTGMSGYQEILTDPSYAKQIVAMTFPHIGNYGINHEDVESTQVQVAGLSSFAKIF